MVCETRFTVIRTHAVMSLIQFIFMPSLFSILENSQIYQWLMKFCISPSSGLLYILR